MKMDIADKRIRDAVNNTAILRPPKQMLATFGLTNIHYYLITEPVYTELAEDENETVLREGRVIAQRPRVVTPYYLNQLEGFSEEAKKYFDFLYHSYGSNAPGLLYSYRNEPKDLTIVPGSLPAVVARMNSVIDESGDKLTAIIKGEDSLWDVSLLKFIFELTRNSLKGNLAQLDSKGLLGVDSGGVPLDVRRSIEEHFLRVIGDDSDPSSLKDELERWKLFDEYQDRFFALFERKS
jgi:hypothetical protein